MVSEEEREQRYRVVVLEFLECVTNDVSPNKATTPIVIEQLEREKRAAAWFTFKSKGYRGLEWWCGLIGISSLRVKRRVKEILK